MTLWAISFMVFSLCVGWLLFLTVPHTIAYSVPQLNTILLGFIPYPNPRQQAPDFNPQSLSPLCAYPDTRLPLALL